MRCCCFAWATSTSCSSTTRKTAARVLGLALTSRDKGENPMPMAGFPYHQLDSYLAKLIAAGHSGGGLRAGRRPEAGQGAGQARSDADRHARHAHRRRPARSAREQLSGGRRAARGKKQRRRTVRASPGSSFPPAGSSRRRVPLARLADELARIGPAECLVAEDERAAATVPHGANDAHAAGRPGRSAWTAAVDDARTSTFGTPRSKASASTTSDVARPCGPPARCSTICARRRRRRSTTSTG